MADRDRSGIYGGAHATYGQQQQQGGGGRPMGEQVKKGMLHDKGPTASQALTVATLFPLGGLLLVLSGLALTASVVGLAVATPVFLIFSPVLVPAALLIGTAVMGFLTSGALGLGGLSSLTCLANTARQAFQRTPDYVEEARRRMAEAAAQAGHKTAQAGQAIQGRAQEAGTGGGAGAGAGGGGRASS
ncbi:Oleosin Zm-II [Zea mays]|uniref:Oleosin Zm-II n=2 Tax=Zea mays TaxID=4577 RepID=OLEO3_MAIZE|nr:RecName: Full=Oleosin Zm-II; AltName: Full=Lipid body-associated protein L2; AltName: Full=Oleosin 18 kDa [Zea mays]AAA67699.1 oleosin KD18 (L2) [Zea mays]PWZ24893.1 Oleosin Zm-II [Zea mays]